MRFSRAMVPSTVSWARVTSSTLVRRSRARTVRPRATRSRLTSSSVNGAGIGPPPWPSGVVGDAEGGLLRGRRPQPGVPAAAGHELVMGPVLDDHPVVYHEDAVGGAGGLQAVG